MTIFLRSVLQKKSRNKTGCVLVGICAGENQRVVDVAPARDISERATGMAAAGLSARLQARDNNCHLLESSHTHTHTQTHTNSLLFCKPGPQFTRPSAVRGNARQPTFSSARYQWSPWNCLTWAPLLLRGNGNDFNSWWESACCEWRWLMSVFAHCALLLSISAKSLKAT